MKRYHGKTELYRDDAGVLTVERPCGRRAGGGADQARITGRSTLLRSLSYVGATARERQLVRATLKREGIAWYDEIPERVVGQSYSRPAMKEVR